MPKQKDLDLDKGDLFQSLIRSLPGLFILFDIDGRTHWWNSRLEQYTGYTGDQIKSMSVLDLLDEQNKEVVKKKIKETFQQGEADLELQTEKSDGSKQVFLLTGVSVVLKGGDFIIATGIDITSKEEERLKNIIDEKNTLLEETHHRIKNNLTAVIGLLGMQSDQVKDEHIKNMFNDSVNRVKSMSMIHEMLYEQGDYTKIDFKPYVKKLIKHLASMYQTQDISIESHVDDNLYFDIKQSIPCSLIINELTSNAFKHGCKGQEKCIIKVSLTRENGLNKLVVFDNGKGSVDINKKTSLGMSLIKGLTQQLEGEWDVQQEYGTSFIIKFQTK
ncbi:MAG: histidine kinase dimerization/phosphoacceptor domain -containing protein [Balneolales bacterium]